MSTPRTRADTLREGSKSGSERAGEATSASEQASEQKGGRTRRRRRGENQSAEKERERERLGLIKQFRYGGRRNMRSYPPSFECVEIFMQLPVRHPRKETARRGERRCSRKRRRGEEERWWHSRHSRLESVPSSVLKRFRSNFEVAGGRQEEGPPLSSSAFENITGK